MTLWVSAHLLLAGLFLSSSALTPEECHPLVTPLSLADPQMMYGRTNFIMGYTDNDVYNAILKTTESSWMKIGPSAGSSSELVMSQENNINGTCMSSTVNITKDGNTLTTSFANVSSVFHMLPSCDGCLVFHINSSARDFNKLLQTMNVSIVAEEEVTAHALYLMARGSTLKDSDLEHFRQQASCLGFTKEPDFHYDPKKGFCSEGEGIKIH